MKEFWNTIQLIFSAVGGWLGYFLGGCDGLLYALIAFVVIDYITGVMCAIINKQLSSEVGFKGNLPQGTDLPAGRDYKHHRCAGDWNRGGLTDSGDLFPSPMKA